MMTHPVPRFSATEVSSKSLSTVSEVLTLANIQSTAAVVNTDKCLKISSN